MAGGRAGEPLRRGIHRALPVRSVGFVSPKTVELKTTSPKLLLLLLLTICFTLATALQQSATNWSASRSHEDNLLAATLGDDDARVVEDISSAVENGLRRNYDARWWHI